MPVAAPKTSGETVTVACKLPNGLRCDLMGEEGFEVMNTPAGQVRTVKRERIGRVFIRGSAAERRLERGDDRGRPMDHEGVATVSGGFGLTFGVDRAFMEAWLAQNVRYPAVKNGLIFIQEKRDNASAKAREQAEMRSGYEPIDPANPGKIAGVKLEPDFDRVAA